jgi:HEAT repeat protein
MKNLQVRALLSMAFLATLGCGSQDETSMLAGGREVESWIAASTDPSPQVRRLAVLKLGNVGDEDPDTEEALASALHDPDPLVRRDAVFAVVKLEKPGEPIITRLNAMSREDGEPGIRDVASRALKKLAGGR